MPGGSNGSGPGHQTTDITPQVTPLLYRLGGFAARRPAPVLIVWVILVIGLAFAGTQAGSKASNSLSLPNTGSQEATDLLEKRFPGEAQGSSPVVIRSTDGELTSATNRQAVDRSVQAARNSPFVLAAESPFEALAAEEQGRSPKGGGGAISLNQKTAFYSVTLKQQITAYTNAEMADLADQINAPLNEAGLESAVGGAIGSAAEKPASDTSELIGIMVAIVILLIAFGSAVSMLLPIVTALLGLAVSINLITLASHLVAIPSVGPTLGIMIGLGVGIDYALFVINRFRQAVLAGHEPKKAAMEAVETAGRAVLFAGSTVIIALLGLWVLGINFFNGLSVAASVTVLMVMLAALWLLPALLSLLGTKALAIRLPWGKKPGEVHAEGRAWAHYGRLLQRRPIVPVLLSLFIIAILAIPVFSLRQGFADDSGKPVGSPARIAYDLRAEGFGPGINGPFLVVADLSEVKDPAAFATIVAGLAKTEGVAGTSPSVETLPILAKIAQAGAGAGGEAGAGSMTQAIAVYPTTSPQDEGTTQLLQRLRTEVNPALQDATGAKLYVGGGQAITSDFTTVLADALPIFLTIVIGLGFLALVLLFRSIVVPLTAAITSVLSFAAAMGITVAIFQWGWLNGPLGVPGTGPIFPFLPIMVFSILFGLSMDYQVFLVSRMQEEWTRTGDNLLSVRRGLGGSGRVVVIAAAIMSSVFLAFVPSTNGTIKLFSIALASAVIIDAFLVRLVLVPAVMSMLGRANWWIPNWLDRILPTITIEQGADEIVDDEPETARLTPA